MFILATMLVVQACGHPVPGTPATTIVDSAGVRVVRNGAPKWGPDDGWTISDEPVVRIGLVDGAKDYLFHDIADITRLSDGTIVALDAGDGELRYFSPDGRHRRTVGREGDGPGEMRAGRWLDRLDGDVVQVTHTGGRLRYAADGTLVADDRLRWDRIHALGAATGLANSSGFLIEACPSRTPLFLGDIVLLCASTYSDARFLPSEAGYHESVLFVARSDWSLEALDTIGTFPSRGMIRYPGAGRLVTARTGPPYAPFGSMRVSGSPPRLVYADARAYRIELYPITGGGHPLVVERAGGLRAPTEHELASFDRAFDGDQANAGIQRIGPERSRPTQPAGNPDDYRDEVVVADSVSIISSTPFVDAHGAIWAPLESPPEAARRVYDIFDADGIYLGQLGLPRLYFSVDEIGGDYIIGTSTDTMGVEYVTIYRLNRN